MTATSDNAAPDPQQIIAELQRKLDESRAELAARNSAYSERIAYQAAANDVLKVMSASPGDPQPVFDLIVERARDLCGGYGATVYQFDGTLIHWRAATGVSDNPSARQMVEAMYPMGPTPEWPAGRAIIDRQIIHIRDLETEPGLTPTMRGLTAKSAVLVPLMRGGLPIGVLALGSRERGGFTDTQIAENLRRAGGDRDHQRRDLSGIAAAHRRPPGFSAIPDCDRRGTESDCVIPDGRQTGS
jgi:GAF domain-containing protein